MTAQLLSIEEIQRSIQERTVTDHQTKAADVAGRYRYIRSFSEAAEDLIEVTKNIEGRFMLGIAEIDMMTRGIGRGELCLVVGRAHSGKTQVVLHAVSSNPTARILYFTPDEVAPLVLSKLMAMHYGINAEEVELAIRAGNADMENMVRRAAYHDFRNLIVVDDSLTLTQMTHALEEAQDLWGAPADLVIVDYLELIPGEDGVDGVVAKSQGLKRWTKQVDCPVICLHQSSRTSAPRGQSAGMNAGKYGGEQECIQMLEVYRKRENESLDEFERRRWDRTVTLNLCKNKRPPSKKGEVDLYMDPFTGAIRSLRDEDMVALGTPITTVDEALQLRKAVL